MVMRPAEHIAPDPAQNRLVPQGGTELDRYLRVLIEFFLET